MKRLKPPIPPTHPHPPPLTDMAIHKQAGKQTARADILVMSAVKGRVGVGGGGCLAVVVMTVAVLEWC